MRLIHLRIPSCCSSLMIGICLLHYLSALTSAHTSAPDHENSLNSAGSAEKSDSTISINSANSKRPNSEQLGSEKLDIDAGPLTDDYFDWDNTTLTASADAGKLEKRTNNEKGKKRPASDLPPSSEPGSDTGGGSSNVGSSGQSQNQVPSGSDAGRQLSSDRRKSRKIQQNKKQQQPASDATQQPGGTQRKGQQSKKQKGKQRQTSQGQQSSAGQGDLLKSASRTEGESSGNPKQLKQKHMNDRQEQMRKNRDEKWKTGQTSTYSEAEVGFPKEYEGEREPVSHANPGPLRGDLKLVFPLCWGGKSVAPNCRKACLCRSGELKCVEIGGTAGGKDAATYCGKVARCICLGETWRDWVPDQKKADSKVMASRNYHAPCNGPFPSMCTGCLCRKFRSEETQTPPLSCHESDFLQILYKTLGPTFTKFQRLTPQFTQQFCRDELGGGCGCPPMQKAKVVCATGKTNVKGYKGYKDYDIGQLCQKSCKCSISDGNPSSGLSRCIAPPDDPKKTALDEAFPEKWKGKSAYQDAINLCSKENSGPGDCYCEYEPAKVKTIPISGHISVHSGSNSPVHSSPHSSSGGGSPPHSIGSPAYSDTFSHHSGSTVVDLDATPHSPGGSNPSLSQAAFSPHGGNWSPPHSYSPADHSTPQTPSDFGSPWPHFFEASPGANANNNAQTPVGGGSSPHHVPAGANHGTPPGWNDYINFPED